MRLLVTRPEPDGERTAAELRSRGHQAMLAPMLQIAGIPDVELGPGPWAGVLITSANGARAAATHPRLDELAALPLVAVGRASAEAARAAGFRDVTSADGDGRDLVRRVASRFVGQTAALLYLAGEERARDLAGELAAFGVAVRPVVVYRSVKAERFPPEVRAALDAGRIDGVLHFSRRSVEGYLACGRDLPDRALAPTHYCLSERAAEPLRAAGAADVRVAERPDEAALLALIASGR
jgi:uroporphyrinogen-III synthase